jgi:hypothetical protein
MTNSHEGNIFVNQSTTLDIADYVKTLFPNFGSAQVAGAVTMYQNQGSNVDQANLVMGECTCVFKRIIAVSNFMGRFSNICLPHILSPLSTWRTSLESELKAVRNLCALNTNRASLQSRLPCMDMIFHTTSSRIRKLKQ